MPAFPIIDSHVHLYDVARLSYGWLRGVPRIAATHGLAEFDTARGGVAVEAMVFVEVAVDPGLHLREAAFVQELAASDARLRGLVLHAPVENGEAVAADLDALQAHPGLRGIRRLIETERDPSICLEPGFVDGVREVGRRGLVFDICVKHWALVFAIELARRCPQTQFVLDHIGKPGIGLGLREPWWSQMRELAGLPNVACKISGVITEAAAPWDAARIVPYVAHAIECFGFDRVLFGSDWPVSELSHRYGDWVALVDDIIRGATDVEQRALYRDTATRVYRLGT